MDHEIEIGQIGQWDLSVRFDYEVEPGRKGTYWRPAQPPETVLRDVELVLVKTKLERRLVPMDGQIEVQFERKELETRTIPAREIPAWLHDLLTQEDVLESLPDGDGDWTMERD